MAYGRDLSLDAPVAEPPGHKYSVNAFKKCSEFIFTARLKFLGIYSDYFKLRLIGNSSVHKRLVYRPVGVAQLYIFSHNSDPYAPLRVPQRCDKAVPPAKINFALRKVKVFQCYDVEAVSVEHVRNFIDRACNVLSGNYVAHRNIAEEGDLFLHFALHGFLHPGKEDVRDNPKLHKFLDRMLCGLGLLFAGYGDCGDKCKVNIHYTPGAQFMPYLADRLEERDRFNIAHCPPDFYEHKVKVAIV